MGALAPLQPQLLIPPICKVPEKQHVYGTSLILSTASSTYCSSMTVACLFNTLREKSFCLQHRGLFSTQIYNFSNIYYKAKTLRSTKCSMSESLCGNHKHFSNVLFIIRFFPPLIIKNIRTWRNIKQNTRISPFCKQEVWDWIVLEVTAGKLGQWKLRKQCKENRKKFTKINIKLPFSIKTTSRIQVSWRENRTVSTWFGRM